MFDAHTMVLKGPEQHQIFAGMVWERGTDEKKRAIKSQRKRVAMSGNKSMHTEIHPYLAAITRYSINHFCHRLASPYYSNHTKMVHGLLLCSFCNGGCASFCALLFDSFYALDFNVFLLAATKARLRMYLMELKHWHSAANTIFHSYTFNIFMVRLNGAHCL